MTAPLSMIRALPQYAVGERIGSGGMGEVFAGVHRSLGRQVAIKQLPSEVADRPGPEDGRRGHGRDCTGALTTHILLLRQGL